MKKIFKNAKKVAAGLVLTMMAVCMVSSMAQGAVDRHGSRKRDSKGYYSYTKVSGYDENGYGYKLKVEARMAEGDWSSRTDYGVVDIRSKSSSYFADAWHRYQIGSGNKVEWKQN